MPPWPLWPGCVPPMALAATGLSIHSAMHADSTAGDPDSAKAIATDVKGCVKGRHTPSIRNPGPMSTRPRVPQVSGQTSERSRLSRRALAMTDTELKVIAALAMIGLSNNPNAGYSTPAATGTPSTL